MWTRITKSLSVPADELLAAVMPAIAFRTIVSAPAPAEAEVKAEIEGEISAGNDTPTPPRKRRQTGNRERKSIGAKTGNAGRRSNPSVPDTGSVDGRRKFPP